MHNSCTTNGSYYQDVHNGVDFVGPDGTPIYSYRDGVVVSSEVGPDGGEGIIIQHDNGLYSYSWHLHFGLSTGYWEGYVNPLDHL